MTLVEKLSGLQSIFLDTAPLIYYIEAHPVYGPLMKEAVTLFRPGELKAYTSVITITEVLPRPVSLFKESLAHKFLDFLRKGKNINLLDITSDLAESAGRLRGKYKWLKTIDALQLSTAVNCRADAFLTNDIELKKVNEITVIVLEGFSAGQNECVSLHALIFGL